MTSLLPSSSRKRSPSLLSRIQSFAPPPWVSAGGISILAYLGSDPIVKTISVGIWLALISTYILAKTNRKFNFGLSMAHRNLIVPIQAFLISFFIAPFSSFAQATAGAGSCQNAGFLGALADFSSAVFTPATTGGVSSTVTAQLSAFTCTMIGLFVLVIILSVVGAIGYAGYQIIANDGQLSTFGRPVAGIVFTVLGLVAFITLATT